MEVKDWRTCPEQPGIKYATGDLEDGAGGTGLRYPCWKII